MAVLVLVVHCSCLIADDVGIDFLPPSFSVVVSAVVVMIVRLASAASAMLAVSGVLA